ncbi:cytochrome P450 71A1 [Amborella trichopoda]|nr:cytochrome P450 71A1 [Amborella trichopoda]|eukprot:XP_006854384.2 cytochrome P450 71A1 [Amborella trichopoda]
MQNMGALWPWIQACLAIVTLIEILWLLLRNRSTKETARLNLPPGPLGLPIIGNLHQLGSLPHRSFASLSWKHGPLMFLQLGRVPTLVISSAKMAKEVMKTQDLAFASRPFLVAANRLCYGSTDMAFAPYGDYWRQVRKICVLQLLSIKKVQSFKLVREEEVASMVRAISGSFGGGPVNLSEAFYTLANNLICRVALGKSYYSEGQQRKYDFRKIVGEFAELLGAFCARDFFPSMGWVDIVTGIRARLNNNFKDLDGFLDEVITEHQGKEVPDPTTKQQSDFVDILLQLQKDPSLDVPLSMDNIKAIILDMFSGGTETSATTLEWLMSELIRNPIVMRTVQEELQRVVGGKGKVFVEEEDLHELQYLQSTIKETLRLYPPAPLLVPRELREKTTINGHDIPANTRVYINAWAIGRQHDSWERVDEFFPERFMNNDIDFKGHDFEFIPFGAGRRGCPGYHFALQIVELAAANLLHCFNWKLPSGCQGLDMAESSGLTMHRKSPLMLVATPRCT